MKTKQVKEELDKSNEDDTTVEPKTRARKKATDTVDDEKNKPTQEEPKTSKEPKKNVAKPKAVVKKRPLGIRKTLRSKTVLSKAKIKKAVAKTVTGTRGRKPAIKIEPDSSQTKETVPLIPANEIKKEPVDDTLPNSRSSSPRTAGRRSRLSSDMVMMKSVLVDTPTSLVTGTRTSPYAMRSERSNSPSLSEGKKLRSGLPARGRKAKNNLLNEVVMKEQNKRRRLLSDSKTGDTDPSEDIKKLKRGRSCSRDGSEISKCSDNTESDISMTESLNEADSKELNKKLDKSKTDLDIDIQNNVQISTVDKVPCQNVDSKLAETKPDVDTSCTKTEKKKKLSLIRSTSLDSDNNNSNRLKLESLNSSDVEDKSSVKTENDTLFAARSSILTSMSKTFNSKEVSKNIRKARRGRKAAATPRNSVGSATAALPATADSGDPALGPAGPAAEPADPADPATATATAAAPAETTEPETLESLSKEIDDLINDLDQNIDGDRDPTADTSVLTSADGRVVCCSWQNKTVSRSKPLGDNNIIATPETPTKDKDSLSSITTESTPSKTDDSENIRLHYEDDSVDKSTDTKQEKTYKCSTVASIDLLMDRLKEFEEFDKRRQRQESESKLNDGKSVMVTNDVVLIPKSGVDIKLKDIQTVRSPERPIEKENVLSCFENNSAISIVKREQARKSIDIDLPNSVTLIKRNSISARKESTSSNHSRESDAISIFEKSLGKDVTLTEIRKSVDKTSSMELHQFAALQQAVLDPTQVSITPRLADKVTSEVQITKRALQDSLSRKSSESASELDEKMATIEKIKSPLHQVISSAILITANPVAVKSPEISQPMEAEALPPPLDTVKTIPEDITMTSDVSKAPDASVPAPEVLTASVINDVDIEDELKKDEKESLEVAVAPAPAPGSETPEEKPDIKVGTESKDVDLKKAAKPNDVEAKPATVTVAPKPEPAEMTRSTRGSKSARNSIECQPGPSNALHETPESQKRKENVLRTLGLLTHKAAKEAKESKAKEKERIYNGIKKQTVKSGDYTGTLKTVIKLNRGGEREKKRHRTSLKMTFQKSKHRAGKPVPEAGDAAADDTYYTIERREAGAVAASDGGHRKSHYSNRLNNHEAIKSDTEPAPEPAEPTETLNLVIPEKASSFSIHPGRLCQDQCFYCGGKFGLFDTPCHIAQMKSMDRQKKVLDNEEKLTIDSCLCDACYRHVDRRANCPSYRKRPGKPPSAAQAQADEATHSGDKPPTPSPPLGSESGEDGPPNGASGSAGASGPPGAKAVCHTEGCTAPADRSIRRKWLIKMRSSVNKILQLRGDYPGLHTIPLCSAHHSLLAALMRCALCRRPLTRHHNLHFLHSYEELNPMLESEGLPVRFNQRLVLCKACRCYCSLLARPGLNDQYAAQHRRKLLQVYNLEVPSEGGSDGALENADAEMDADADEARQRKKARTKKRKSADPDKPEFSESSDKTSSSPEKPLEEDIESLISSNKIPVPGAKPETDPSLPADKRTELQYLLQRQNNPAQFLPNLTQKTKNITKLQTPAIIKPGSQQRILDKNSKRIQKLGQVLQRFEEAPPDPPGTPRSLNDECTIESVRPRPADITSLKTKWQMSESFSQVKKNLSELKKLTVEKEPRRPSPVRRLETNPSISVRELFPGEEEMQLQAAVDFASARAAPHGWERTASVIQYDAATRRLWTELQRPYGNQSSFLRHLILLEKYFRSGDLVLAAGAAAPAAAYSESAQARLRAYDNAPSLPGASNVPDATRLADFRRKPATVVPSVTPIATSVATITATVTPSSGKSLLRPNDARAMPPPPARKPKEKGKNKPPELIAINTPSPQGRKAIQNVLHNIQQLVKGVSAADPTEVAAAPLPTPATLTPLGPTPAPPAPLVPPPPPTPATITAIPLTVTETQKEKKEVPKEKKDTPKDKKESKKQKVTSKPWRPTLMPITQENLAKIGREPTQVAVDGRKLPSLVQVISAGKRYHITLQDYNKMCVMRREKMQQLQEGGTGGANAATTSTPQGSQSQSQIPPAPPMPPPPPIASEVQPHLTSGGAIVATASVEPETPAVSAAAAAVLKSVGLKNITIAPVPPSAVVIPRVPASLTVIPQLVMPALLAAPPAQRP